MTTEHTCSTKGYDPVGKPCNACLEGLSPEARKLREDIALTHQILKPMRVNFGGMSIAVKDVRTPTEAYDRLAKALADAGFEFETDFFQTWREGSDEEWEDMGDTASLFPMNQAQRALVRATVENTTGVDAAEVQRLLALVNLPDTEVIIVDARQIAVGRYYVTDADLAWAVKSVLEYLGLTVTEIVHERCRL